MIKKTFLFIFSIMQFINLNAQCTIDLHRDYYTCGQTDTILSFDSLFVSGVEPFDISWTCYFKGLQSDFFKVKASDYLDDTTILHPKIINWPVSALSVPLIFKINVTDAAGCEVVDSLTVLYKQMNFLPEGFQTSIHQGDTIKISPPYSSGGVKPFQYLWTPNYNISDVTSEKPYVWPSTKTIYYVTFIDSVGCSFAGTGSIIDVVPVSNIDIDSRVTISVSPNPVQILNRLKIRVEGVRKTKDCIIYDNQGINRLSFSFTGNDTFIDTRQLPSGVYYLSILVDGVIVGNEKFVVVNK